MEIKQHIQEEIERAIQKDLEEESSRWQNERIQNSSLPQVHQEYIYRASLVAQWLRICLLMQETRVRALVWEDPTCRGATRPVSHNY